MIRTQFVLCGVLLCATTAYADNWPEFRGPTGQGHADAPNLPVEWSPTKNVLWSQDIPGTGWSSPVVVDNKVYLTTAVNQNNSANLSLRTLCLDAKTGKILWNVEVFEQEAKTAPRIHSKNSHASPTPIVQGERIYVHFGHQGTACLDLTGKIHWQNRSLKYAPVHGNGGSPTLIDGILIFSIDGAKDRKVVALDAATGKVKWQTTRQGDASKRFSFSTPLVIEVKGKKQVISPGSDMVGGYDVATGEELWYVKYKGYSVIPRPVYAHGLLFISTSYDTPRLLAIDPEGKGDISDHVKWKLDRGAPHTPSMLVVGEELYIVADNGIARCLDAKTGTVHWQKRLGGNGYSASPIHANGRIYFLSENGIATVIKASKTYEELARNDMKERTLASYAVADNCLYLRTATRLFKIGKGR